VTLDTFRSPGGHAAQLLARPDTSDWNTLSSILTHDEYGLPRGRSGVAVDVGAHIGGWTIGVALDNPDMRVIAVEILPDNVELLERNIAAAGVADRVTVLRRSASNRHGPERVAYGPEQAHRYIGDQNTLDGRDQAPDADGLTLADVVDFVGGSIDLLKIDCEGCEFRFLDSPALTSVAEIVGEYHGPVARLLECLEATHVVEYGGETIGPFRAVLR
jgi:FkbM family methyltransferase